MIDQVVWYDWIEFGSSWCLSRISSLIGPSVLRDTLTHFCFTALKEAEMFLLNAFYA